MKRSVKEQESRKGMKVEEIFAALDMLEKEKGIPQHYMMDKITQALINAYKHDHPDVEEVLVRVDEEHRTLKMYIQKTVVDEVENPGSEISRADAKAIAGSIGVGETVSLPVDNVEFGRIAAGNGKQIIIQGLKEAERDMIYNQFSGKEHEILTGTVTRIDPRNGNVSLRIGTASEATDALLSASEQVPGEVFTEGERVVNADNAPKGSTRGKVYDLLIPVIVLIVCCVIGMIYVGGFFEGVGFIDAFSATDASVGLPWGSLIALLFAIVYYMCRRLVSFKEAMNCLTQGFIAMVPAMLILTFAVTLKTMTGLLGADVYVAGLMQGASAGLTNMLPAIIFLVACFLAFASGTSWGTFGILIPIVTGVFTDPTTGAIVPGAEHLIIIGVAACLAGAVMGDHCSPISDTTIMASAGAQCNHINHVSTQVPYVLTVAAISFVTYIIAGFVQNVVICLVIGILLTLATLVVLKRVFGEKAVVRK